jgi:hypothetical protein
LLLRSNITATFAAVFLFIVLSQGESVSLRAQTSSDQPAKPVTSETAERALRSQWRGLFESHSWTELDSLADRLRSQRLRFQGGGWQLHVLYCILSNCSQDDSDATWESQIAALQEWILHSPSSPTPRIALADTCENFAWKARGSDFADKVSKQGWSLFAERMQKAHEALEQAKQIGRDDPEWYNSMLVATAALEWDADKADALVDESLSREPGYFYIARIQADNLLPKWYGERGDTERFVAKVADRIGGADGDATYFFVAEYLLTQAEKCIPCAPPTMSWTRIRQGYAAIQRLYGTNNFEMNAYAFLAMRAGDRETARQAFEKIGENWNADVWETKRRFESSRLFPYLKPVPLARPRESSPVH